MNEPRSRRKIIVSLVLSFLLSAVLPAQALPFSSSGQEEQLLVAQIVRRGLRMVVNSACKTEELIRALEESDYKHQRRRAAQLLGDRGAREALPSLLKALKDPEEVVQIGVAEALAQIGDKSVLEELVANMTDSNPRVRKYSAYVLGRVGTKDNQAVVAALEKAANDEDKNVRIDVVYALYELGPPSSKNIFIEGLNDEESRIRSYSATALGSFKDAEAAHALVRALEHETDEDVRRVIASSLGKLGSEYAVEALVTALPLETETVRADIAAKLGEVKTPRAIQVLTELLLTDPSPKVRAKAATALLYARDPSTIPALVSALKDRVPIVRRPASEALLYFGDASAIDQLIDALGDSDHIVANNAARALIRLGELDAIHGLIKVVNGSNLHQAQRAMAVLGELTQRPYGGNAQKWIEWYEENIRVTEESSASPDESPASPDESSSPPGG